MAAMANSSFKFPCSIYLDVKPVMITPLEFKSNIHTPLHTLPMNGLQRLIYHFPCQQFHFYLNDESVRLFRIL